MIHVERRFQVKTIDTQEDLIEQLTQHSWTLCTGFRFSGFLWLNDAFSEDGAQEYAVVVESQMVQVESITVSWCSRPVLKQIESELHTCARFPMQVPVHLTLDTPGTHGTCRLCE